MGGMFFVIVSASRVHVIRYESSGPVYVLFCFVLQSAMFPVLGRGFRMECRDREVVLSRKLEVFGIRRGAKSTVRSCNGSVCKSVSWQPTTAGVL